MSLVGAPSFPQVQQPHLQAATWTDSACQVQRGQGMQGELTFEPDLDILISYERDNIPQHVVVGGRAVGQQVPQGLQTLACKADGVLGVPAGNAASGASQSTAKLGAASLPAAGNACALQVCGLGPGPIWTSAQRAQCSHILYSCSKASLPG